MGESTQQVSVPFEALSVGPFWSRYQHPVSKQFGIAPKKIWFVFPLIFAPLFTGPLDRSFDLLGIHSGLSQEIAIPADEDPIEKRVLDVSFYRSPVSGLTTHFSSGSRGYVSLPDLFLALLKQKAIKEAETRPRDRNRENRELNREETQTEQNKGTEVIETENKASTENIENKD